MDDRRLADPVLADDEHRAGARRSGARPGRRRRRPHARPRVVSGRSRRNAAPRSDRTTRRTRAGTAVHAGARAPGRSPAAMPPPELGDDVGDELSVGLLDRGSKSADVGRSPASTRRSTKSVTTSRSQPSCPVVVGPRQHSRDERRIVVALDRAAAERGLRRRRPASAGETPTRPTGRERRRGDRPPDVPSQPGSESSSGRGAGPSRTGRRPRQVARSYAGTPRQWPRPRSGGRHSRSAPRSTVLPLERPLRRRRRHHARPRPCASSFRPGQRYSPLWCRRRGSILVCVERKVFRTELNPVDLLRRAAYVYPEKVALVHGERRVHVRRVRRSAAWRLANGAPRRRAREGRSRRDAAPELPGDARGALRRPGGRRRPRHDQHAAVAPPRSRTSSSTRGARFLLLDAELDRLVEPHRPRRRRRDPGRRHRRAGRPVRGSSSPAASPERPREPGSRTRRRRSRSTTRPARPAGRRASSTPTAART